MSEHADQPEGGRPQLRALPTLSRKVVVEARYGPVALRAAEVLWEAGLATTACSGPSPEVGGMDCPVVAGRRCPLVENAEAVVYALDPTLPADRRLLRRLVDQHPELTVIAWLQREAGVEPELPDGVEVVGRGQVGALRRALARHLATLDPEEPELPYLGPSGDAEWYWVR